MGELGSLGAIVTAHFAARDPPSIIMMFACGILGFLGFKVFEIGDAIVGPFWDNSRYDDLRSRYDLQKHSGVKIAPIPLVFVNSSQRQVMVPGIVITGGLIESIAPNDRQMRWRSNKVSLKVPRSNPKDDRQRKGDWSLF